MESKGGSRTKVDNIGTGKMGEMGCEGVGVGLRGQEMNWENIRMSHFGKKCINSGPILC